MVKISAMSQEIGRAGGHGPQGLPMSLEQVILKLASMGIDGIELECGSERLSPLSDKAVQKGIKETADSAGITIVNLAPHQDFLYPFSWGIRREMYALKGAMEMSAYMGVQLVRISLSSNIGFGAFPPVINSESLRPWTVEEQYSQGVQCVREATRMAEDIGVTLVLENHRFLPVLEHLKILQEINSPNLKLNMDVRNCIEMDEDIISTVRACGKLIAHCHIKDGRTLTHEINLDTPMRLTHSWGGAKLQSGKLMVGVLIGDGNIINWEAFLSALKETGYKGFLSIEGSHVLPMYDPWDAIQRGAEYLRNLGTKVGI